MEDLKRYVEIIAQQRKISIKQAFELQIVISVAQFYGVSTSDFNKLKEEMLCI